MTLFQRTLSYHFILFRLLFMALYYSSIHLSQLRYRLDTLYSKLYVRTNRFADYYVILGAV